MAQAKNISAGTEGEWKTIVEPFPESWNFKENPVLVGVYQSKKELEQDGLDGNPRMVWVYTIEANGTKYGVWGSYNINAGLADIEPGTEVRIQYDGTVKIDNGARSVKQFTIQTR